MKDTVSTIAPQPKTAEESTKDYMIKAITELFINRDLTAVDRYFAEDYIQHNAMFDNGREVLRGLFANMPPDFKYEMGMVIAEGDLVMFHGRATGFVEKPLIAMDVFRLENGLIAEHWDVFQEEVIETANGNPMFVPDPAFSQS